MRKRQCARCAKWLEPGSLSYVVQIRVHADFDGILIEPEEGVEEELEQAIEQAERSDPEELEKEVFEEIAFYLCKDCRDRFVQWVRNLDEDHLKIIKGYGPYLH